MTTKLILINTDTHVVVPRELNSAMDDILYHGRDTDIPNQSLYTALIAAAPQLTTPPMLRWEGGNFMFCNWRIANLIYTNGKWKFERGIFLTEGCYDTEQEARRAAEKALELPEGLIIPEV